MVLAWVGVLHAQQVPLCSSSPACFRHGRQLSHFALNSAYPFSEDISGTSNTLIQWDPAHAQDYWNQPWTVVQGACPCQSGPPGNVVPLGATNVLLRGSVTVQGGISSIPSGTLMEVELLVDSTAYGHFVRLLRPALGTHDAYVFGATVQNLSAVPHTFSLRARLLSAATVFVSGYTTSVGVPASVFPYKNSEKVAGSGLLPIGTGWTSMTAPLSINQATSVDVGLLGYVQLNDATGVQTILFRFRVDGSVVKRQSMTAVPPSLGDGINVIDHWLNLAPGPHTIELQVATNAGSGTVEWRQAEYVAFPRDATSPSAEAGVTGAPACDVNSDDSTGSCDATAIPTPSQPEAQVQHGNGYWTLLAETTIDGVASLGSWALDGYVQFLGGQAANTWGQFAFETITSNKNSPSEPCTDKATDMGFFNFPIPSDNRGFWAYGDAGQWGTSTSDCPRTRVRMWIRPVLAGKSFSVGDRYFSVKIVPAGTGACRYDAPPPVVGLKFYTVPPCRITDTRGPTGPFGGPALVGLQPRRFNLTGVCGIPTTAVAVAANITATDSTALGALQIFPTEQAPGNGAVGDTSTINYSTAQTRANNAELGLACDGRIDVIPAQPASTTVQMILDVVGYYQ